MDRDRQIVIDRDRQRQIGIDRDRQIDKDIQIDRQIKKDKDRYRQIKINKDILTITLYRVAFYLIDFSLQNMVWWMVIRYKLLQIILIHQKKT